jgi:hypothetical protein
MVVVVSVVPGSAGSRPFAGGDDRVAGGPAADAADAADAVRVSADAAVPAVLVDRVRAEARSAVAFVGTVWPGAWTHLVEVTVAGDGPALAASAPGLGLAPGQVDGIAALAVVPVGGRAGGGVTPPGPPGGHLIVNAQVYARLSPLGARVVLRHEVTHLASADATPPDMPVWLVEGFADAVARSDAPDAILAPELAADVAAGWLPTDLLPHRRFGDAS